MESKKLTNSLGEYRNIFAPKSAPQALCNQRFKLYPDKETGLWYVAQVLTYDRPKFNPSASWELRKDSPAESPRDPIQEEEELPSDPDEVRIWKRSYNRARSNCFDLLMCNPDLDTFVTFTVDPSQADRQSYPEICSKLSVWLSNRVQRRGLKYILVPEYHKDGVSIHFHGIMNWDGLELSDSGHKRRGQKVYNVADLPLGFSTAIRITGEDALERVSKYIWKYMTKQKGQKIGGRFFLHGGSMTVPRYEYRDASFEDARGHQLTPFPGSACKIIGLTSEKNFLDDSEDWLTNFRNPEFTDSGMSKGEQ